jgi:hypothetical protein
VAYGGRTRALTLVALLGLAALVAVVIVLAAGKSAESHPSEDAAGAVQRFLVAAGSGDGDTACGYLSLAEQHRVEVAAGSHVPCSQAFLNARFDIGGTNYLDDLGPVDFSQAVQGDRATVDATAGTATTHFALVPASQTSIEEQSYQPPSTNWRIDRGAEALVRPVP